MHSCRLTYEASHHASLSFQHLCARGRRNSGKGWEQESVEKELSRLQDSFMNGEESQRTVGTIQVIDALFFEMKRRHMPNK